MIAWQSIYRALPKDGERVLAWVDPGDDFAEPMFLTWRARGSEWWSDMKHTVRGVTHWARIDKPEGR